MSTAIRNASRASRASRVPVLYDGRGNPVRALTSPAGGVSYERRLERINAWREQYNPLRGLTLDRVVRMLEDYRAGRMADLQWAHSFIEETDPDLIGLLEARISRLLEMDYNIATESELDAGDESLAEDQAGHIGEKCALIDNLYDGIEHLAMSPFRGFSHCEKYFGSRGDIFHLEIVDQWNVVRDGWRGRWRYNPAAESVDYRYLPVENELDPARFLFRESRRPINRFAFLKFFRSTSTEKDWDAFNEIYNVPGGVVIGPPDVPEEEEAEYEEAARRVAEGGSGYLPYQSQYTPNTPPHDAMPFVERLKFLSEKLVLAGTGGKLTMLAESGSGTLAGSAHQKVFDQIASAEARRISEVINRQLVAPWLAAAFPGRPQLAYFQLAANEETDTGDAVEQVSKLAAAGYQVDPDQVTEKTGWRVTLKPQPDPAMNSALGFQPPVRNRASRIDAGQEARFLANSAAVLTEADRAALAPVQKRVAEILALDDDAAFKAAIGKLQADLPDLEKQCLAETVSTVLVDAFSDIIGTALLSGMEEAAEARAAAAKPETVKNRKNKPSIYRRGTNSRPVPRRAK